ncbi:MULTISPECIES: hypothetical protein [Amycolatopsis]|uniref:Uncharacterized protein n=1 Tax=Amycolatopsis albidoflavus TaxID=102226 RepID=A0ABW5HVW0_9PSEU
MKRIAARILLPLAAAGAFAGFAGGVANAATPETSAAGQPAGLPSLPTGGLPSLPTGGLPSLPTGGLPSLPTGGLPSLPTDGLPSLPSVPNLPTPGLPGVPGAPAGGGPSVWVVPGLDAGSLLGPTTQAPAQLLAPVFNAITAVS